MSVSAEFRDELERGFRQATEAVIRAETWARTRAAMISGTYPYLVAIHRIEEGWIEDEIRRELNIRLNLGEMYKRGVASFQPGA